ncbi:major tail protein [Sinanaerobacter chloroacetimidivorans]|uniref:Phage tail protein n=1 Tax=Sinanaerobacter chloroacetimidivorans TaxID=2818044 RepID=A0A8J8B1T9_9FIRM|nr:major tail protein [Sinanaerobacter chloroacetimidivorans]MBR0599048.1 phage tail protein [Sinanaerobacter chloroacetimidivorans]
MNLSLEPDGEIIPVYADNVEALSLVNNKGYTGELELLIANDAFKAAVLGEELVSGVQFENADAKPKEFALAFQFEGDVNEKRHWLYRCKCSRPNIASSTKGDSIEPVNDTLSITVRPRIGDKLVKASVDNTTENTTIYANWFSEVYEKSTEV